MTHASTRRSLGLKRLIRRSLGRRAAIWRVAGRSGRALRRAPRTVQAIVVSILLVSAWAAVNWMVQVARKPTEVFAAVGSLPKSPAETWQQYGSLFHRHSTEGRHGID